MYRRRDSFVVLVIRVGRVRNGEGKGGGGIDCLSLSLSLSMSFSSSESVGAGLETSRDCSEGGEEVVDGNGSV